MKRVDNGRELKKALKIVSVRLKEKDMAKVMGKLTLDGYRELMTRSAKKTGYLRSNWSVLVDATPPDLSLEHPGGPSYPDARPPSQKIPAFGLVSMFNNTEYAILLETGTARMRAQPMVWPTYYTITSQAENLAKALSKKEYRDV